MWPVEMSRLEWAGSSLQDDRLLRADGLTAWAPSLNCDETLLIREEMGSGRSVGGLTAIRWRQSSCGQVKKKTKTIWPQVERNLLYSFILKGDFETTLSPINHNCVGGTTHQQGSPTESVFHPQRRNNDSTSRSFLHLIRHLSSKRSRWRRKAAMSWFDQCSRPGICKLRLRGHKQFVFWIFNRLPNWKHLYQS